MSSPNSATINHAWTEIGKEKRRWQRPQITNQTTRDQGCVRLINPEADDALSEDCMQGDPGLFNRTA